MLPEPLRRAIDQARALDAEAAQDWPGGFEFARVRAAALRVDDAIVAALLAQPEADRQRLAKACVEALAAPPARFVATVQPKPFSGAKRGLSSEQSARRADSRGAAT